MEKKTTDKKSQVIMLFFLLLALIFFYAQSLKNKEAQVSLKKPEVTAVAKIEPVAEIKQEAVAVQAEPVVREAEQPAQLVPEKRIVEKKIKESNKGYFINDKKYVYFGTYKIVKEEETAAN